MITNHYCEKCEEQGLDVFDYKNTILDKPGYLKTKCLNPRCRHERNIPFMHFSDDFIKRAVDWILRSQSDNGQIISPNENGIYEDQDGAFYAFGSHNVNPIDYDEDDEDYNYDDLGEDGYYGDYRDYYENEDGFDDHCG